MRLAAMRSSFRQPALVLAGLLASVADPAAGQQLPLSSLSVLAGEEWERIWDSGSAPRHWESAHPALDDALRWQRMAAGVEQAEVVVGGDGSSGKVRLVLVRIDPMQVRFEQVAATREGGSLGAWTIAAAPMEAIVALNGGQFRGGRPWGWVVRDGAEIQPPGTGSLAMALTVLEDGSMHLIEPSAIPSIRSRGGVRSAIQSYPMLLYRDGEVPHHLRGFGRGVDVEHRDARLAVGELRDGRILFVLTRFEGLGSVLGSLPFGPTIPEMAGIMGALGCHSAMLLDGGLSGQLLVRQADGTASTWNGMRRVPLGLVFTAAGEGDAGGRR